MNTQTCYTSGFSLVGVSILLHPSFLLSLIIMTMTLYIEARSRTLWVSSWGPGCQHEMLYNYHSELCTPEQQNYTDNLRLGKIPLQLFPSTKQGANSDVLRLMVQLRIGCTGYNRLVWLGCIPHT